jgi:acyl-CoA synthetase (AMP-forming)/AMP-acid ligase II
VVLLPDRLIAPDSRFLYLLEQEKLTIANLPASYWHAWVRELADSRAQPPASLRLLIIGSERVSPGRLAEWLEMKSDHVHWMNAYGTTETTVTSVLYQPTHRDERDTRSELPVGRPIANTEVFILDDHWQPVPIGTPGSLHIGGAGLARGYLNRPALTAERFIPNPFSRESGARLYRTGDLARHLSSGNVQFLGRAGRQMKIRGYRIELGEIKAVLTQHPAVREVVLLAQANDAGRHADSPDDDVCLVAYIVTDDGQKLSVGELRRFLQETLPEYMIPSAFIALQALPLLPNGKVDRRALPLPDQSRPELEQDYVAPRSEAERIIAAVWKSALRVEKVGVRDNFFSLGGHSLLLVQVHSQLVRALKKEFPMTDMFRFTTVAALAAHLSQPQEHTDIIRQRRERAVARRASLRQGMNERRGTRLTP